MSNEINGFHDFYTVISNERKVGGVIEAQEIRLRSGEVYQCPVFTNIDYTGSTFYTICFITEDGNRMIVNVNDISAIKSPAHKHIQDMNNNIYKEIKVKEKLNYLKRLCKADQGAHTKPFVDEAVLIIKDVGYKNVENENDISVEFFKKKDTKVFKIA